tara:strand:+ start:203 stop:571 length:369 start_codon:yes stop_codon:yes gene_type:complete
VEDKEQSRKSATAILALKKDIEHLKYILDEQDKDTAFLKNHTSTKNSERLDDIRKLHVRMDSHIQTELEYHQGVRDKVVEEHQLIHKRISQTEKWIWIFFGGFTVLSAILGKASFTSLFGGE